MTTNISEKSQLKKELFVFLIITFGATYLLDFVMYGISGPIAATPSNLWTVTLPIGMFIPATAAIICMLIFQIKSVDKGDKNYFRVFLDLRIVVYGRILSSSDPSRRCI